MYLANEWAVAFAQEPKRRVRIVSRHDPKPSWAEQKWCPPHVAMTEDVACRAVLRVLVSEGYDPEMVDQALGEGVQAWHDNPQRVMWAGGKNKLLDSFNAVSAHLSQGGRLRDVPVPIVERVGNAFGLETFAPFILLEQGQEGPFPPPYDDLVGDLWTQAPADALPRPAYPH